jgi:putative nucleotidyltransferase with HDIG domain
MVPALDNSDFRQRIERFFAESQFLPPAFQLVPRLLLLLDDPNSETDDLADLVRVDTGLTTDVLKICNSALYAGSYRINTVKDAILRIGVAEVYRIVMAVIASPVLRNAGKVYGAEQPDLWNHSLLVATAAQTLAQAKGDEPELVFTAGLLHDVGKTVLNAVFPDEYHRILREAKSTNQALWELERASFKVDHAEVGAQLLQRWNFPLGIVLPVKFHPQPSRAPEHNAIAAYIYAGNVIAYRLDQGMGFPSYAAAPDEQALAAAGLAVQNFEETAERVLKKCSDLQRAFS